MSSCTKSLRSEHETRVIAATPAILFPVRDQIDSNRAHRATKNVGSRQYECRAPQVFQRDEHIVFGGRRGEFRLQPDVWRRWVSCSRFIGQRVSFQPFWCECIWRIHASKGIMSYHCPNCVREKLVRARMAWFEYLSFFLLVRLWKCPHCFRHYWRPVV